MSATPAGLRAGFTDAFLVEGVRTPFVRMGRTGPDEVGGEWLTAALGRSPSTPADPAPCSRR